MPINSFLYPAPSNSNPFEVANSLRFDDGSSDNLTMDHVRPRSMGGQDKTNNVVCCCHKCNKSKAATNWEDWYSRQDFFTLDRTRSYDFNFLYFSLN